MDRCVSKPPCFKFLMAGIRLSLSSGPMATSMALTFYIRTLLPLLILRTSMPDDGGRSSEFNEQALVLLRAMARTQSHTHVGSVGQQGLHQRATTVHSELACRAAGTSSFQSQSWGVKQAEAEGQSMERSVRRPSEGRRSVPAWRQIAKGTAGATAEPRALKQQGVPATESLAPKHPLTDPLTGSRKINLLPALQRLSMPADERPRQDDGPPAHRHPPPKQVIPWPRRVAHAAVPPDNSQSTSPAPSGPTQCKLQAADKLRGG